MKRLLVVAAFIYWCFNQAAQSLGIDNPVIRTGGCLDHWVRAAKPRVPHRIPANEARQNFALVRPGLIGILLIDAKTGAGHTFLVESCDARTGAMVTVEGNADPEGGNNGTSVLRLTKRHVTDRSLIGFLDYSA